MVMPRVRILIRHRALKSVLRRSQLYYIGEAKMQELELLKKLHDTYKKRCSACYEAKHVTKFKRKNRFFRTCNDCHRILNLNKTLNVENEVLKGEK
jgi:hypothetical protein